MNVSKRQLQMIIFLTILSVLLPFIMFSQTIVSGTVTQSNGTPIEGANVYLDGTYDGASTGADGSFLFKTTEKGVQTLVISFVSYETVTLTKDVLQLNNLVIKLRDDLNSLDTVVISAGSFEASDNSKVSVLKPLDVVTTASALGDFVGALQTLPGTTTVAEDGRLFVRGGEASETQIFIDGIRVFTPYTPTTNNIPTRGRYSPFLFDGITFSTGGYSAEYGQALSSVLLLNTIDEPTQEKTDISLMSVGLGIGNTQKWNKNSLSVNASYINLAPYIALFPDRNNWEKPYEGVSGEAVYRHRFKNGLLKSYIAFDTSNFALTQEDINVEEGIYFNLKNANLYGNTTYNGSLSDTWKIRAGASYTFAKNKINRMGDAIDNTQNSIHLKLKVRKRFSSRVKIAFGVEQFITRFSEDFSNQNIQVSYGFDSSISALFSETDIIFNRKFAVKLGLRGEYVTSNNTFSVSPRISTAYKTGKNSQFSIAYGVFYQQPEMDILKFNETLKPQQAQHFLVNYQYAENGRILRLETFYKQYDDLVTYDTAFPFFNSQYGSLGSGYAKGVDVFWRDNTSVKNVDYWVSYSFLDSKRSYKNYPIEATPPFANTHNLSVVGKYWVDKWKSQLGFSYQFASGRSYTNPNIGGFLQNKTRDYHNVSVNWAYLISQQKILYFSINNVFNFKNINSFQYSNVPDNTGFFNRRALRPAADQFFFVGFFWTISDDKTDNQLDNL